MTDDVLYGAEVLEVFQCPMHFQQVGLVDGGISVQKEMSLIPTEIFFKQDSHKHAYFPVGIVIAQIRVEKTLYVAYTVGRETHVGGVHGCVSAIFSSVCLGFFLFYFTICLDEGDETECRCDEEYSTDKQPLIVAADYAKGYVYGIANQVTYP